MLVLNVCEICLPFFIRKILEGFSGGLQIRSVVDFIDDEGEPGSNPSIGQIVCKFMGVFFREMLATPLPSRLQGGQAIRDPSSTSIVVACGS